MAKRLAAATVIARCSTSTNSVLLPLRLAQVKLLLLLQAGVPSPHK